MHTISAGLLTISVLVGGPAHPRAAPLADFPFDLENNLVIADVQVNGGSPQSFIFDTGFEYSLLNTSRATMMGLMVRGERSEGAPGGAVTVGLIDSVRLTLPQGAPVFRGAIHAVPLDALEPVLGRAITGIIGHDFFRRYVVEIDYAHRHVRLYDPASYAYSGRGRAIPVAIRDDQPFLTASLMQPDRGPIIARLKLDVGSADALGLNGSFVRDARLFPPGQTRLPAPGAAVGGETQNYVSRIAALQIGSFTLRRPVVGYSVDTTRTGDAGTLGGDVLRRFTITIDYRRSRLILEPDSAFDDPFEYDMSGLFLVATGTRFERIIVQAVADGSPAAAAGLRHGDRLLSIDGRPASSYGLSALRMLLRRPGATVVLQAQRGVTHIDTTLHLRRLI